MGARCDPVARQAGTGRQVHMTRHVQAGHPVAMDDANAAVRGGVWLAGVGQGDGQRPGCDGRYGTGVTCEDKTQVGTVVTSVTWHAHKHTDR